MHSKIFGILKFMKKLSKIFEIYIWVAVSPYLPNQILCYFLYSIGLSPGIIYGINHRNQKLQDRELWNKFQIGRKKLPPILEA